MKVIVYYRCGLVAVFYHPKDVLMVDIQKAAEIHGVIKKMEIIINV